MLLFNRISNYIFLICKVRLLETRVYKAVKKGVGQNCNIQVRKVQVLYRKVKAAEGVKKEEEEGVRDSTKDKIIMFPCLFVSVGRLAVSALVAVI